MYSIYVYIILVLYCSVTSLSVDTSQIAISKDRIMIMHTDYISLHTTKFILPNFIDIPANF